MVEIVESVVMWVEGPMTGLYGSWASGLQEEAGAVVGLAAGLFADVVEAASKWWWAQW
jgi:hypothetical protein